MPTRPVHPRACGEHRLGKEPLAVTSGSSPRRGEHDASPLHRAAVSGSSPRLRGTLRVRAIQPRHPRFIPAPAGNTLAPLPSPCLVPVHPRACGEHEQRRLTRGPGFGSSPRLRGTRGGHQSLNLPRRFIPAPAGNTKHHTQPTELPPVHPRACGEHSMIWPASVSLAGSSPRLRGTQPKPHHLGRRHRFIPAPAGNTSRHAFGSRVTPVHPRACGEHLAAFCNAHGIDGSSPRLRGTHHRHHRLAWIWRFIPAPAGNTPLPLQAKNNTPVHPRACGEHPRGNQP